MTATRCSYVHCSTSTEYDRLKKVGGLHGSEHKAPLCVGGSTGMARFVLGLLCPKRLRACGTVSKNFHL